MTMESEVTKYLQEIGLPEDEGTYPPELMGQITIKVIEDLREEVENLEEKLAYTVPEEDLWDSERRVGKLEIKIYDLEDKLEEVTEERNDLNKRINATLKALNRMRKKGGDLDYG